MLSAKLLTLSFGLLVCLGPRSSRSVYKRSDCGLGLYPGCGPEVRDSSESSDTEERRSRKCHKKKRCNIDWVNPKGRWGRHCRKGDRFPCKPKEICFKRVRCDRRRPERCEIFPNPCDYSKRFCCEERPAFVCDPIIHLYSIRCCGGNDLFFRYKVEVTDISCYSVFIGENRTNNILDWKVIRAVNPKEILNGRISILRERVRPHVGAWYNLILRSKLPSSSDIYSTAFEYTCSGEFVPVQ